MEKEVTVFVHSVTQALQKTKVTKFACRNKSALAYKEGLNHIIEASKGRSWLCVAMFDVTTGNWNCNCPVSSLNVWPQCQRAYCCDFLKLRSWSCRPQGSHKNGASTILWPGLVPVVERHVHCGVDCFSQRPHQRCFDEPCHSQGMASNASRIHFHPYSSTPFLPGDGWSLEG